VGAALRFPDVQRPRFDDEILSFTQMPDPIWTDPSVSDLEVRVHGFLVMWNRHHGRFPTIREIARSLPGWKGHSRAECTVSRALHDLERAGYLVLGRRSQETRYEASLGYRLKTPGPKPAARSRPERQEQLFPTERDSQPDVPEERATEDDRARSPARDGAQNCALFEPPLTTPLKEERETDRLAGTREGESGQSVLIVSQETEKAPEAAVLIKDYKRDAPADEVSAEEYLEDLNRRAIELFDVQVKEETVAQAVAQYGHVAVDTALQKAEERTPQPEYWGWVLATLKNWKREDKLPEPADPRFWMGNYNPPAPIEPVTAAGMPGPGELTELIKKAQGNGIDREWTRRFLRSWVAAGALDPDRLPADLLEGVSVPAPMPAEGVAGRGPSLQTFPRPAGGPSPQALDYTVNNHSRQKKAPSGRGQLPR